LLHRWSGRIRFKFEAGLRGYVCIRRKMVSYVERTNLTVRTFNKRFARLSLGYSKKIEYLRAATALFIAHFNFCRKHSTLNTTPARWAKLTDHQWTTEELLNLTQPVCHEK
jgi:hypothetical protein